MVNCIFSSLAIMFLRKRETVALLCEVTVCFLCLTVPRVGSNNYSEQFIKIISHYEKIGKRQHAWWSTQSRLATLLSSLIAVSDSMTVPTKILIY